MNSSIEQQEIEKGKIEQQGIEKGTIEQQEIEKKKEAINRLLEIYTKVKQDSCVFYDNLTMFQLIRHVIFTNEIYESTITAISSPKYNYNEIIEADDKYIEKEIKHSGVSEKNLHEPLLIYLINEAIPNLCKQYNLDEQKKRELINEVFKSMKEINELLPNETYKINLDELKSGTKFIDCKKVLQEENLLINACGDFDLIFNNIQEEEQDTKSKKSSCIIV